MDDEVPNNCIGHWVPLPVARRQAWTKNCVSIPVVLIIYYACKPSCMLISKISFWSCPTLQYSNRGHKNISHAPTLSNDLCDLISADLAFAWMLVNCIIFFVFGSDVLNHVVSRQGVFAKRCCFGIHSTDTQGLDWISTFGFDELRTSNEFQLHTRPYV